MVGERRENKGSGYELMHIDVTDGASRARPPRLDDAADSDMRVTARRDGWPYHVQCSSFSPPDTATPTTQPS